MRKNKRGLSTVEFLPFTDSLPETKSITQNPPWKQIHPWAGGAAPATPLGALSADPGTSTCCLWGMCQIRFLCNFQTLNKWTSRAKCFLRLGSDFCAHTRVHSQTTHTAAGCGRAIPAGMSLLHHDMPALLFGCKRRLKRREHSPTWWLMTVRLWGITLPFSSPAWLNGALHTICLTALPRTPSSPLHLSESQSSEKPCLTRNRYQTPLHSESTCYLPHVI